VDTLRHPPIPRNIDALIHNPAIFLHSLRAQLSHLTIPTELDTDLNLLRWQNTHDGDVVKIARDFGDFIEMRRAGNIDHDLTADWTDERRSKLYLKHWSYSMMSTNFDDAHDTFVSFECAMLQPHEVGQCVVKRVGNRCVHTGCTHYVHQRVRVYLVAWTRVHAANRTTTRSAHRTSMFGRHHLRHGRCAGGQ
jgi:hypothetical protein